ncbi:hypothetical protein ABVT39_015999, partial [Epinephelus coioides]
TQRQIQQEISQESPTLTPPLELSLHNRYDALAPNEICDNTKYTEPRQAKAIQNASNSPKTTARPRARKNDANSTPEKPRARRSIANTTPDQQDTILIGDSITKHVRMAKTKNLTVSDKSVRELTELLPVILSTPPSNMRIIIHAGSFDILRGKTGSEILKKDFSLLLEKLTPAQPPRSQRRPSPPPPQSPRSQHQPSPPPPRSPIKELVDAATLKLKLKLSQT